MEAAIGSLERAKEGRSHYRVHQSRPPDTAVRPISHLVYVTRGDDVQNDIVNGKVLMKDGQVRTLDRNGVVMTNALAQKVRAAVRPE